ncbi:hypothetical protein FB451DRAFT_1358167 [Mycena latifolia]|nr:hypothetical protein FB451DRAFT_1358167 [Mycena latifolia]
MGRPAPATVTVSAQTVADLAKGALVPIRCEVPVSPQADGGGVPVPCAQELSCWKAFYKHQVKKHSSKRKMHNGEIAYVCRLNKCSAKSHLSSAAFKTHVELSHMKNISLPCPFSNCAPLFPAFGRPTLYNTFLKEKDLIAHLEFHHADLIGCELDLRSEKLLPSWKPRPPIRPLPLPPPLPSGLVLTASLRLDELPPRIIRAPTWFERLEAAEADSTPSNSLAPSSSLAPPTSTPQAHTPKTPTGRHRLLRYPAAHVSSPPDPEPGLLYDFDELPEIKYTDDEACRKCPAPPLGAPDFVVQRAERCALVRALPMREAPMPERPPPPKSIFIEALRQQVFAQYADGESAAADLAPYET